MQCFLKSKYIKSRTFNDKNRWIIKKVMVFKKLLQHLATRVTYSPGDWRCDEAWREQTLVYPPVLCQQRLIHCTWELNVMMELIGPPSHWSPISLVPHLIGPASHWSPISLPILEPLLCFATPEPVTFFNILSSYDQAPLRAAIKMSNPEHDEFRQSRIVSTCISFAVNITPWRVMVPIDFFDMRNRNSMVGYCRFREEKISANRP